VTALLTALAVAAIVMAAVVLVAWPFVSPEREPAEPSLTDADRERLLLSERRDEAYAGLRDLEQDVRTGKITQHDYDAERARLRAQAAEALRGLDRLDVAAARGREA
jgi:hypothetical protein